MRYLFTLAVLAFALLPTITLAGEDEGIRFGMRIGSSEIGVDNMPLYIRDVPVHKDDLPGTPGIITKTKYYTPINVSVIYPLGKSYLGDLTLETRLNWMVIPAARLNFLGEYYYQGSPGQPVGNAMTFCGLEEHGIIPNIKGVNELNLFLNVTPEIALSYPLGDSDTEGNWQLELTASYFRLQAFNGWDRYECLEYKDIYPMADCVPITLGVKKNNWSFGIKQVIVFTNDRGKAAGVNSRPALVMTWYNR